MRLLGNCHIGLLMGDAAENGRYVGARQTDLSVTSNEAYSTLSPDRQEHARNDGDKYGALAPIPD